MSTAEHVEALGTKCALERDGSVETRWRGRHGATRTLVVVTRHRVLANGGPERVERWTVRGRARVSVSLCTPKAPLYSYSVEFWGFGATPAEAEQQAREARRVVLRGDF